MTAQCQSCGMPLITKKIGDCRGTEADGSKSEKWCSMCYANGAFIDESYTLAQMQSIVDDSLKEQGRNVIFRWLVKNQIPTLERWRS